MQNHICKVCGTELDITTAALWLVSAPNATALLPKERIDCILCPCKNYVIGFVSGSFSDIICELVYSGDYGIILFNRIHHARLVKTISSSLVGWLYGNAIKGFDCELLDKERAKLWLNKVKTYVLFQ